MVKKHIFIDCLLFILIAVAGAFFFQFVRGSLAVEKKVDLQALQANALIEEVGQAKEENRILYEKLLEAKTQLDLLKNTTSEFDVEAAPAVFTPSVAEEILKVPRPKILPDLPGTTNFLVVGQHKKLADTIMIAAVNMAAQKITLISLPRDLVVNGRKINEYLSLYGPEMLRQKVEYVSSIPLHHTVVLNFEAFEAIIDALGGIDVNVERTIYDPLYPNEIGGYTVYSIDAGSHHLSGAEALQYARSRHSTSDFDRAKRQQQILTAVQERVLNFDFLSNAGALKNLFSALANSMETDLSLDEIISYAQSLRSFSVASGNVISTENFLYSSANIGGQYILLPRNGNWTKIQRYIREILG
ncbi:LCP family protein [Candidatus Peregrinibacteria bacterium]|nr:LCP family protein [Candidatus Peregrinibacteria bacterium]